MQRLVKIVGSAHVPEGYNDSGWDRCVVYARAMPTVREATRMLRNSGDGIDKAIVHSAEWVDYVPTWADTVY